MNNTPVIVIGMGEMGSVFARCFLRLGHPVYPVVRGTDMAALAEQVNDPALVLVAVGETALQDVLAHIPGAWSDKLALLQHELLPGDFSDLQDPTVISVWFEKKKGQDSKVLIPSPVFGPRAGLLIEALGSLDIASREVHTESDMLFELVAKNVYIMSTNIAGLRAGGTVGSLWENHRDLAVAVASEVIALQEAMTGAEFDRDALIEAMLKAFEGDLDHKCMGRSAPARLQRALAHSADLGVNVPTMRTIAAEQDLA